MYKNMKILIEGNLDEITKELKIKKYSECSMTHENPKYIVTTNTGWYFDVLHNNSEAITTLSELKEM